MNRNKPINPLDLLTDRDFQKLAQLESCEDLDFLRAVEILELDPRIDFRFSDLQGIDLEKFDLSSFDFTGAVGRIPESRIKKEIAVARSILEGLRKKFESPQHDGNLRRSDVYPGGKSGVYIWGPVGSGKTSTLQEFLNNLVTKNKVLLQFHEFENLFNEGLAKFRKEGAEDVIASFTKYYFDMFDVVCIDDFEVVNITVAMAIERIFEVLWESNTFVVVASEIPLEKQYEHGLNRQLFVPFVAACQKKLYIHQIFGEARSP